MAELKPCPFCGGENIDLSEKCESVVFIQCDDCCATFPHFDTKEEAITAWNTRTKENEGDSESEEIVLKQENFAELPVDKFTPELTPEEKALIKLWKGQGGRDELESVLRMFGAKMDGGQTE